MGLSDFQHSVLKDARHRMRVMINCKGNTHVNQLKLGLQNAGFDDIKNFNSHVNALVEAKEFKPQVIFFSADTPEGSEVTALQFVEYVQKACKEPILIALSIEPDGETLFSLLKAGAHAFLVPSFTAASIEGVLSQLNEGIELSEEVLNADDRNAVFAEFIREHLDHCAKSIKQRVESISMEELSEEVIGLEQMVRTAKFFCEDDPGVLMDRVFDHFVEHAKLIDIKANKTRLRETRERLRRERSRR